MIFSNEEHLTHTIYKNLTPPLVQSSEKEDELKAFSADEKLFLRSTVPYIFQRPDRMIEILLPLREPNPELTFNRQSAERRTRSTLQKMREKDPKVLASSLEKFKI